MYSVKSLLDISKGSSRSNLNSVSMVIKLKLLYSGFLKLLFLPSRLMQAACEMAF